MRVASDIEDGSDRESRKETAGQFDARRTSPPGLADADEPVGSPIRNQRQRFGKDLRSSKNSLSFTRLLGQVGRREKGHNLPPA
jgi:hypothetical protein